jgi:hypothetical protein
MANGNKSFYFRETTARQLELIALATGESKGAILRRLIAAEMEQIAKKLNDPKNQVTHIVHIQQGAANE